MNDFIVILLTICICLVIVILAALLIQNTKIRKFKIFPIKTRISGNEETMIANQLLLKLIDRKSTKILANIPLKKPVSIGRGDLVTLNISKYLSNPLTQHRHIFDFGFDDQGYYINVLHDTVYSYGNDKNLNRILANTSLNIENDCSLYVYFGNIIYCFGFQDDVMDSNQPINQIKRL